MRILISLFCALFFSGCFSIQVPLNVPPKIHYFSDNESNKPEKVSVDSSKSTIFAPALLWGGAGYLLGAGSYDDGRVEPSIRERLVSPHAIGWGSVGGVMGVVLGHQKWKRGITVQTTERDVRKEKLRSRKISKRLVYISGGIGMLVGGTFGYIYVQENHDYYSGPLKTSNKIIGTVGGGVGGIAFGSLGGIILSGLR